MYNSSVFLKEVIWCPPLINWFKANTDGAATKNPKNASAGSFLRDHNGICIGCFAQNLGPVNAFHAEFSAAMLAIEAAHKLNTSCLWLETNSKLVVLSFKSPDMVPWQLKNRWLNCLYITRTMLFSVSRIYREGNACADSLANLGLSLPLNTFEWWNFVPHNVRGE